MNLRTSFTPGRGIHSLVRIGSIRCAVILAMVIFFGCFLAMGQTCASLVSVSTHVVDLDACRPAPITAGERTLVLRALPVEGEVTQLTNKERQKLRALGPLLRLHGREGVYELKVIALPQAWTGLYERAVLLISLPALRLLSPEELEAVVAHDIGHEYVWPVYAAAQKRNDAVRLRELELACDTIAVLSLTRLGVKPNRLVTAVEKGLRFNYGRFGRPSNENSYPAFKIRRELVKRMSRVTRTKLPIASLTKPPYMPEVSNSSYSDLSQ